MKKFIYLFMSLFLVLNLMAYELPDINISDKKGKPEIIFFTAESIVINKKQSYILKWKTLNATKVTMTYLGKMALDGNVTVTSEEFNSGAIVLKATSNKSKYVDSVTINGDKDVFDETNPIPKNSSGRSREFYDTVPNTHMNPYNRRRINHPGMLPRRYY